MPEFDPNDDPNYADSVAEAKRESFAVDISAVDNEPRPKTIAMLEQRIADLEQAQALRVAEIRRLKARLARAWLSAQNLVESLDPANWDETDG